MSLFAREPIYAALFARVAAAQWTAIGPDLITTWRFSSRKLLHWTDCPLEKLPAFFQTQREERIRRDRNMPPVWVLAVELFVYVQTLAQQDSEIIPSQQLNPFLDSICGILEPGAYAPQTDKPERTTLGGLVDDCKIVGTLQNFEGDLGDLGVLIIPVEMTVPL